MSIGFWITQIVDRDDLDWVLFAALVVGAQDVAPDAAVTVDGNLDGHKKSPVCLQFRNEFIATMPGF
jgi:hypothetical protein